MDYELMSDFEINSSVHNVVNNLGYKLAFIGDDKIKWSKSGQDDIFTGRVSYTKNGLQDYCNNISIAWPIIDKYKIAMIYEYVNQGEWFAGVTCKEDPDQYEPWMTGSSALRNAMIVFLMMNEGKS